MTALSSAGMLARCARSSHSWPCRNQPDRQLWPLSLLALYSPRRGARQACASCVTSPVRLCQSRHRRRPPSERRAASESSCRPSAADLVVRAPVAPSTHAHALSRRVRRVSSDITAPLALHRRFGSVRADTGDARRASAEPRASRRADRAPPTSSCVRSVAPSTHAHALSCRVRRVSSDITAPLALHRRLGSVRADTGDARRASAEPRASRRVDRAPPA